MDKDTLEQYGYRLWTIQDAKDGDVLDANGAPFIYKKHNKDYVYFYCGVNLGGYFIEADRIDTWDNNNKVYPATKEQRDLLFKKMAEAGYEWDAEKKETKLLISNGGDFEPELSHQEVTKKSDKVKWSDEDEENFQHTLLAIRKSTWYTDSDKKELKEFVVSLKQRLTDDTQGNRAGIVQSLS